MMIEDTNREDDLQNPLQQFDIVSEGELTDEEVLSRTVLYTLDQGAEKLVQNGGFDPFTILISGEELFIEDQPGDTEEESYESARRTIYQMEHLCNAYTFCYDGFVELEDEPGDAIVIEYANKGDKQAQIVMCLYHIDDDDEYHFDENLYQVGETETLFSEPEADEEPPLAEDTDEEAPWTPETPESNEASEYYETPEYYEAPESSE